MVSGYTIFLYLNVKSLFQGKGCAFHFCTNDLNLERRATVLLRKTPMDRFSFFESASTAKRQNLHIPLSVPSSRGLDSWGSDGAAPSGCRDGLQGAWVAVIG